MTSELTQSNKDKLQRILNFPYAGNKPLDNKLDQSKTITTVPNRQHSKMDELDAILRF